MKKPKKEHPPRVYDDNKHPLFWPPEAWLNSPFSIARFYGAMNYNGARYEIDELTEDLCREDVAKARREAYTPQDLATIKAKYTHD